ncbi:MAG TPA: hypothetical protein EYP36_07920 [Calditrichaeota bacterium]|nr:hypothetical protein [Calditrichota bacterium]
MSQVVFPARISQSISKKIGIYVQYRGQFSPTKHTVQTAGIDRSPMVPPPIGILECTLYHARLLVNI